MFLEINSEIIHKHGINTTLWLAAFNEHYNNYLKYGFDERSNFYIDDDGYLSMTQKEIKEATSLSVDKQTKIIKYLKNKEILKVKKIGLPAKNYYKIIGGIL